MAFSASASAAMLQEAQQAWRGALTRQKWWADGGFMVGLWWV
jgi:hypothetical protein